MGRRGKKEYLRRDREGRGDAVRSGCCGCAPRFAPGRCAQYDLHRIAGSPADDSQYVQDFRRTSSGRIPCLGASHRRTCPFHIRRPSGRDGHSPDGLRHARHQQRSGGNGPRRRGASGSHQVARAVSALLRRIPYVARDTENRAYEAGSISPLFSTGMRWPDSVPVPFVRNTL